MKEFGSRCWKTSKQSTRTKSILWKNTDFLRNVVSEKGRRGAMTFTYACEHCDLFLVEDFLRWVGAMEKRKKNHEWEVWSMRDAI